MTDLPRIPNTLEKALDALKADQELLEILPADGIQTFIVDKEYEIAKAKAAVADYGSLAWNSRIDKWEHNEFMELL